MKKYGKHENYEILNLIGYGLAKYNKDFIREFGYTTKSSFYEYIINIGIAETPGTIKNRQDLFDPFFNNPRKGWWQKSETYIHRKILIDSLFGDFDVAEYSNIVKLYLFDIYKIKDIYIPEIIKPITQSKFRQIQETGLEAELYFLNNYSKIDIFYKGILEDARLFGDGYDFQIEVNTHIYLVEVKGLRESKGSIRFTEKEYNKAGIFKNDFGLAVISQLSENPKINLIFNPLKEIKFERTVVKQEQVNFISQIINW